jgi:hypothetical protein
MFGRQIALTYVGFQEEVWTVSQGALLIIILSRSLQSQSGIRSLGATAADIAQANMLAPPLDTASISSSDHAVLRNRLGNSSLSKYSPSLGLTGPNDFPAAPPTRPYVTELVVGAEKDGVGPPPPLLPPPPPNGPCCWALER